MSLKYKVGNKVRIKSFDWYNQNKDEIGVVKCGDYTFTYPMTKLCCKTVTVRCVNTKDCYYVISEDDGYNSWTEEMIEGLVEEESKPKYEDEVNGEYYSTPKYLVRPSGYQFVDENGNVINATKIVLKKKKREFPKTYAECSLINGCEGRISLKIIGEFTRLINARNAYWKIAGEEMGLEKSWEPDWCDYTTKYCIIYSPQHGGICKRQYDGIKHLLAFPTAEMRDAFYENFKDLIERCKELL